MARNKKAAEVAFPRDLITLDSKNRAIPWKSVILYGVWGMKAYICLSVRLFWNHPICESENVRRINPLLCKLCGSSRFVLISLVFVSLILVLSFVGCMHVHMYIYFFLYISKTLRIVHAWCGVTKFLQR